MKWSRALLLVTGFSYIGAAIMTLVGYPPETTVPPSFQILFYLCLGLLLMAVSIFRARVHFELVTHEVVVEVKPRSGPLFALVALYGVLAVTSFSGIQKWVNYNGSSDFLGVAMAAWDLAVAVALLDEV